MIGCSAKHAGLELMLQIKIGQLRGKPSKMEENYDIDYSDGKNGDS
jgi:hypothetical protein